MRKYLIIKKNGNTYDAKNKKIRLTKKQTTI